MELDSITVSGELIKAKACEAKTEGGMFVGSRCSPVQFGEGFESSVPTIKKAPNHLPDQGFQLMYNILSYSVDTNLSITDCNEGSPID